MNGNSANFLYLNRDNSWIDFQKDGLEIGEDGALRLASLPLLREKLPEGLTKLPHPNGPAGIAVSPDGTIYYTDTSGHRLMKIDSCDGALTTVLCLGREGEQPTQFREPRGVLFHPTRQAIFVADSGNHRIQIFDSSSFQLIGIWGQKGTEPGYFDTPWTLAGDSEGNVYVVDYGNHRVQKFDFLGNVIPAFWETIQKESNLDQPIDIAVGEEGGTKRLYIIGLDKTFTEKQVKKIFVFDANGYPIRDDENNPVSFGSEYLKQPMGIIVTAGAVYVGDNSRRRVLKFKQDGTFIGESLGYEGPVAALAIDIYGDLLVHTGSDLAPVRLLLKGGYVKRGILWGGPFKNPSFRSEQWHRLKANIDSMPAAHFRLFIYTFTLPPDTKVTKPTPPPDPIAEGSFDIPPWKPVDLDVPECIFPGKTGDYIWVGVEFIGEGLTSPVLSQMRLDFDHQTYIQYLPAIYKEDDQSRSFLIRFLSLFESLFDDIEDKITNLSILFDPYGVPVDFLAWLAGWLAIHVDENWSESKKRQAVAEAFEMYAERGTAGGLRRALHFFAGVDVRIEEPILHAAWWSLPADETSPSIEARNSILGFTTMLAPAEAQGAVVGTTAVLDQSHLITREEFGVPLFEDVAHQFVVQVYRGQVHSEKKLEEIRTLIDHEKPAHTAYHLCVVEPRMRVGFQSTVGVDTVIAGPLPPSKLGEESFSSANLILGGEPTGRIGKQSQIGKTTRLGEGVLEN